jgi:hypothetical protein
MKPCLPSRTAIGVDRFPVFNQMPRIMAGIKVTRAMGILLLFCSFAIAINAQQPQQTHIVFVLSLDDLIDWKQTNVDALINIRVKNINRPSESEKKISLLILDPSVDSSNVFAPVVVKIGQPYTLTQYLNAPLNLYEIQRTFGAPGFIDQLNLKITEVSWPNETGTIVFNSNHRERVSAFINLSLEPQTYQVTAEVNHGGKITQIVNLTESFTENKSRYIPLTAPTLFGTLWHKLISLEGLLGALVVALATILIGVLKDKIKAVFDWALDFLGKYLGGKLAERRFFKRYIDNLSFNHKYLKLIGFNTAGISRPLLEEVFVSLRIASNSLPVGSGNDDESQDTSTISFNSAFKQYKYMAILGGPGAGKTTTLSYALLMFAQQRGVEKFGIEADLLPIYIPLRRLSNTNRSIIEDLTDKETQILSAEVINECPPNYFERKMKKGRCLVLLDGLDEVTDERTHRQVAQRINSLVAAYPENRFVVTCRIAGWKDLLSGEFKVLWAQNFSRDEIQRFVLGWHKAVITQSEYSRLQLDIPDKEKFEAAWEKRKEQFVRPAIDIQSRRLIYAIDTNTRILAIAVNPMLLSLISLVHFNRQYLPRGRTVLYSQCIELLIDSWERTKDILSIGTKVTAIQKEAVLREIAFNFQVNGKGEESREKLERLIEDITRKLGISMTAKELLEDIELRSGLLAERSIDVFGFSHLTLQEYLVAKHIQLNQGNYGLLTGNFDRQEWREVILLYTGLVDDATELIKAAASADSVERQTLAGYCIGDAQHCDSAVSEKIVEGLIRILNENSSATDDIIDVLSAIAADFNTKAVSVEERLSEKLINTITDDKSPERVRLDAITILGRARVTRALQPLMGLMHVADTAVRGESIKAIIQFGNLALPILDKGLLFQKAAFISSNSHFVLSDLVKIAKSSLPVAKPPKPNQSVQEVEEFVEPMVEVLSGINTGQSVRQLIKLYDWQHPLVDQEVSIKLAQMMTNTFVETDLLDIESTQLPQSIRSIPIDRTGWSYTAAKSGFWHIDTKIRSDVLHSISLAVTFAPSVATRELAPLRPISFKILFPALLSYIRNLPGSFISPAGSKYSKYKVQTFEDLGFDEIEHNKLHYLVNQINKSFAIPLDLALQNIGSRKTSDYSYETTKGVKQIVWIANIYFTLFYTFTLFFVWIGMSTLVDKFFYKDFLYQRLPATPYILLTTALFFYICIILLTKYRLKKGYLTKKFLSLAIFPIANFLKVLPYLTRRKPWIKLVLFQLLTLCFSPIGVVAFYAIYSLITSGRSLDSMPVLAVFFGVGLLFVILSSLYWKYYVLSQNPVSQLMLMHPQGRKIASDG